MVYTERFEERYQSGNTPWDHGQPDSNLMETVASRPIPPCKALDVGCGTMFPNPLAGCRSLRFRATRTARSLDLSDAEKKYGFVSRTNKEISPLGTIRPK
ncbi:MAG: hypothetical protein JXM70_04060 [Pirellulales bacterium]|nr:hypothetical protein [Pirellulales bacterium]